MQHALAISNTVRGYGLPPATGAWRALYISLGLNSLLFLLFFAVCTPIFASADDPSMMKIAAGAATGSPDAHLVFMNILLGYLMKWGFTTFPQQNCYALLLYGVLFFADVTLCYCLLRLRASGHTVMAYLLLFVALGCYFLENPQFTSMAFLIGMSGGCLAAVQAREQRPSAVGMTVAALSIILAGMLRFETFFLLLLVMAPYLGYTLYQTRSKALALTLILAVMGFVAVKGYDMYVYAHTPGWSHYFAYQRHKSLLYDYPGLRGSAIITPDGVYWEANQHDPRVSRALQQVGWSDNDVRMFLCLLSPEDNTFSLPVLRRLTQLIPKIRQIDLLWSFRQVFASTECCIMLAMCCITLPLLARGNRRLLLSQMLLVLVLCVCLLLFAKLPPYLATPLLYYLAVLGLLLLLAQPVLLGGMSFSRWLTDESFNWRRVAVLCGALALAMLTISGQWRFWRDNRINAECRQAYHRMQADLLSHPERRYVATVPASLDQWMSPFEDLVSQRQLQIMHSGWSAASPLANTLLQRFHAQNPYEPLFRQANCYLLGDQVSAEIIRQYLREHFAVRVRFTREQTFTQRIGRSEVVVGFYQFQRE